MPLTQQIGKLGLRRSAARVLNADRCRRSSPGSKPTALGELLPLGRSKEVKDGSVLALGPQMQMDIGRRGRPRIQIGHRVAARARDETTFAGFDLANDRDATNTIFKHTRGVGDKAGARQLEHITQEVASADWPLSHPCDVQARSPGSTGPATSLFCAAGSGMPRRSPLGRPHA